MVANVLLVFLWCLLLITAVNLSVKDGASSKSGESIGIKKLNGTRIEESRPKLVLLYGVQAG